MLKLEIGKDEFKVTDVVEYLDRSLTMLNAENKMLNRRAEERTELRAAANQSKDKQQIILTIFYFMYIIFLLISVNNVDIL